MIESPMIALSLSCPACNLPLASQATTRSVATDPAINPSSQDPVILSRYTNEGGLQPSVNILPLINEEAYLADKPSHRHARAYLTMCAEGDIGGIIELLQDISDSDEDEGEENSMSPTDLLRYQDPLDGMKSGLHLAVAKSQMEVVWLLLWLASGINSNHFPQQALTAVQTMGASREIANQGLDIRALKNAQGKTAAAIADRVGGAMAELVRAGFL